MKIPFFYIMTTTGFYKKMLNIYYLLGVENFAYFAVASSKMPFLLSKNASRKIT